MSLSSPASQLVDTSQPLPQSRPLTVVAPATSLYTGLLKPAFDIAAGLVLSVLTLPIIGALALCVRATMGPGVLFRQERVGLNGRAFTVYKLRTLMPDRRREQVTPLFSDRRVSHKRDDDPRHRPVGRFLRRWSLDELPQFWNVLLGDMSLIGPRPELPQIVRRYAEHQHQRHLVKPGITGLWQVTKRGSGLMHEQCEPDLAYVATVSVRTDLKILTKTFSAVVRGTGN